MRTDRLRSLRERNHLTQEELAERVDVQVLNIWRYENAKSTPNSNVLARIAKALNTTMEYLMGTTDDPDSHLRVDNLTPKEREVIAAMRRGEVVEAIKAIIEEN